MGKREKLIKKILESRSVIRIEDAINLLIFLDYYAEKTGSSYETYRKDDLPSVTLVLTQKELKPYIVEKLKDALRKAGY
jgi:hypothetical protein